MQKSFDFGLRADLEFILHRLRPALATLEYQPRLEPAWQLVRSLLGSREKDANSWAAFWRIRSVWPQLQDLASASTAEIEARIAGIHLADLKARHIVAALTFLASRDDPFDIGFLKDWPVDKAHAWLASIDGVGPKIAASMLNFSTLGVASFVVDTHVQRVLRRLGCVGANATIEKAYRAVMGGTEGWSAKDYEDLHVALKLVGQTCCADGLARCAQCPLDAVCRHRIPPRSRSRSAEKK